MSGCNCKYYCDCKFTEAMIRCKIEEEKKDEEFEKLKEIHSQETMRLIKEYLREK